MKALFGEYLLDDRYRVYMIEKLVLRKITILNFFQMTYLHSLGRDVTRDISPRSIGLVDGRRYKLNYSWCAGLLGLFKGH